MPVFLWFASLTTAMIKEPVGCRRNVVDAYKKVSFIYRRGDMTFI